MCPIFEKNAPIKIFFSNSTNIFAPIAPNLKKCPQLNFFFQIPLKHLPHCPQFEKNAPNLKKNAPYSFSKSSKPVGRF